jgi:hypothetical protein
LRAAVEALVPVARPAGVLRFGAGRGGLAGRAARAAGLLAAVAFLAAPDALARVALLAALPFLTGPLFRAALPFLTGPLLRAASLFLTGLRPLAELGFLAVADRLGAEAVFRFAKRLSLPYRQTFGSR